MRILFLHFAREWSGSARMFAVAARGLAARGHSVTFVAEPHSSVEQAASRVAAVASKLGSDPDTRAGAAAFDVMPFDCGGFWLFCAWRLRRHFREWDTDVVFVHTEREHLIAAVACRLGGNGRIVRRSPANAPVAPGIRGRIAARLARTAWLFATESDASRARLPRNAGPRTVATPAVDIARYPERIAAAEAPREDIRYIICVYDPTSRGRAATAIRTVSKLAPRHPYLRLFIFGVGSDSEDLRMQAAALDILHLVSFLGERDDHLALMRDAELGWVVAEADTAAFGILDLMALGVPVIAPQGSVAEEFVANQITGTLVPGDDAATTAAIVVSLLTNEEQRRAMGAAGRARVAREFPEKAMIDGFEASLSSR